MYILISLFIIILTASIIKDTHVTVYKPYSNGVYKEYNWELSIGLLLFIILVGLLPYVNIIVFVICFCCYIVFCHNVDDSDYTPVLSLRGDNKVTKLILKIIEILKRKI